MIWALLAVNLSSAAGRPCGEAEFTSADFESWVTAADEALNNDDVLAHGKLYRQIQDNVPCLVEPIPTAKWAEFLIGLAVVDHASGDPWEPALTTAMLLEPDIDRSWLQPELKAFAPMLPSPGTEELPDDAAHFVDGEKVSVVPPLPGVHILQREYVGVWEGAVVTDGDFPIGWRTDKPVASEPVVQKKKRGPRLGLVAAGAGGAAVFGATSLLTGFAGVKAQRDLDQERYGTMRGLNNTAVALTGVSAGVATLGFVLPTKK